MEKIGEKEEQQEDLWQQFCGSGGRWCAEVEVLGSLSSSRCWEKFEVGGGRKCCGLL